MKYSRPTFAICAYFVISTICEQNYVKVEFLAFILALELTRGLEENNVCYEINAQFNLFISRIINIYFYITLRSRYTCNIIPPLFMLNNLEF